MIKVSRANPLKHYTWGESCEGWNFVELPGMSVKEELMPAGTSEQLHYHQSAQQFFYILTGKAVFEVEDEKIEVNAMEGIHIPAGLKHRIINNTQAELRFILSSVPSTLTDRYFP